MKNLLCCVFILFLGYGSAQKLNGYKYIQVPEKFSGFKENQYQLNFYLKQLLKKNNFTPLGELVETWPEDARQNPCMVLKSDLNKTNKLLKNSLELRFTDCKGKEAGTFEGVSKIKEFNKGYQEALRFAMAGVGEYTPSANVIVNTEVPVHVDIETAIMENKESGPVEEIKTVDTDGVEYTNGEYTVVLTQIPSGSYLLKKKSDSSLIAQLWHTSRGGVFKVTVVNSKEKYTTTGFYDPTSLTIDFMEDGKINTVEFKRINK